MNTRLPKFVLIPLIFACLAVILFLIVEITLAPLSRWSSDASQKVAAGRVAESAEQKSEGSMTPGPAAEGRERNRCEHCGIVESTRRIAAEGNRPMMYEVTVRLADRSKRVFSDPNAPRWRPGERIVLIEGGRSAQE